MQASSLHEIVCAIGAVTMLLGGCARSQTTRFYVLTPALRSGEVPSEHPVGKQLVLGIGPIRFPEYLDRPQITGRTSGNRLTLAEFDRWAEPLESGFSRVLAENLSALLSTDRVLLFPWKSTEQIDYRITVDVVRFDGGPGERISLVTRWAVFEPNGSLLVPPTGSTVIVPASGPGYEALAGAMSKAVGDFSLEIASALRTAG